MKKTFLLLFTAVILTGCAAGTRTIPKAIYAVARHDRYSGVNASREYFRRGETPCVKIAGYGSSTFSYRLYKEGMLESVDSGSVDKIGDNEVLTCWKNLPAGYYRFHIYGSSGAYVDAIEFSVEN